MDNWLMQSTANGSSNLQAVILTLGLILAVAQIPKLMSSICIEIKGGSNYQDK